ncbi:MAG: hypothetical protein KDM64_00210 [Verrucomicrobiae bacterium]|nr:hypothetical protein [Verrucomicrobiae bacterium]
MPRLRLPLPLLIAAALLGLVAGNALAQSRAIDKAEAQRGQAVPESPESEPPREESKAEEPDPSQDRTPLGIDLHAIRLLSHQDKTESNPAPGSESVSIDAEIAAPDSLHGVLEGYVGQPASM